METIVGKNHEPKRVRDVLFAEIRMSCSKVSLMREEHGHDVWLTSASITSVD
jgi:hypothetical protein